MSGLVNYDSGEDSASEMCALKKDSPSEGEADGAFVAKEKMLEDEWDSFNKMISRETTNDDPTSAPCPPSGPRRSGKNKSACKRSIEGTNKSSSLYDPLNKSSDDDDDDDVECDIPRKETNIHCQPENKERNDPQKAENKLNSSEFSKSTAVKRETCSSAEEKQHNKVNKKDISSGSSVLHGARKRRASRSPSPKKSTRKRSRSRERHGRRHDSRSSSGVRHGRRSPKSRKRSRSRSRHHEGRRHRSRSHSSSRRRHSRGSKAAPSSKMTGPAKGANPKNFKEQLKAMFLQTQNQTPEEIERDIQLDDKRLLTANEKKSYLPLNSNNPLAAMVATGSKATPQQALAQTMAAMHAKVQEITGVAVPKYYNPAAINPIKYAEQLKKRKLLWSKNKEVEKDKETDTKSQAQWSGTSFVSDQDGKMAAKFRKLMGIKEDETLAGMAGDVDLGKLSEEQRQKQEQMFQRLDREYEFARMTTHTCRGVGLGFTSHNLP